MVTAAQLTYGTFSPDELMPLIPSLFVGGNFLTLTFFGDEFEFDTEFVHFDRVLDDLRMAPLVAPLAPGKVQQPRGYQMETIIPASLKPRNPISPSEVLKRMEGEALGGSMSASDRAAALREKYLLQHQMKIARRKEWMAASLLKTGSLVLTGDDYPSTTVDFDRDTDHTATLGASVEWGDAGVSPYDDVDSWLNLIGEAVGSAADIVIMDRKAWALYIADTKAQKALDRTLGQTTSLSLGFTPGVPGRPQFKGRDGDVEFYVYNDTYEADNGSVTKLFADYTVVVASRAGMAGAQLYGVVQHAENNYALGKEWAHNWIDKDTGAELIETITAPILAPKRVNASACFKVKT